jgi:WD40 repeat protein
VQRVFISYSRVDIERAAALQRALDRHCDVFLDLRDIPVSVPWFDEIQQAMRGAALMLALDSAAWRSSENCQAELIAADRWLVPVLRCAPHDLHDDEIIGRVITALDERTATDDRRSELFVRAGNWSSLGRGSSHLVGGRTLRRYLGLGGSAGTVFPTEVHEYLGACRRRQKRVRALRTAGVIGAVLLVWGGITMRGAFDQANQRLDDSIVSQDDAARLEAASIVGPYAYLDALVHAPTDFVGALAHHEFARALSATLPQGVQAPGVPGNDVLVPPAQIHRLTANSPDGRLTAQADSGAAITVVDAASGVLNRRVLASRTPSAIAWSPFGTELAVAVGRDIELLDVRHGTAPVVIRGASAQIDGIAFVGNELNAHLVDDRVVTWASPVAGRLPALTDWAMDARPIPGTSRTVVLGRDGTLSIIDAASGTRVAVLDSGVSAPSVPTRIDVGPDGKTVAVAASTPGKGGSIVLVDLASGNGVATAVTGCTPSDVSFDASEDTVYFACLGSSIGVLDVASRQATIRTVDLDGDSASIVSVSAARGRLVVGTDRGKILELDPRSASIVDQKLLSCAESVTPVRLSHDGIHLYHGGTSAANFGCDARGDFETRPTTWHKFAFPGQDANQVHAVAVSPDDQLVAFGFSDGSVWIFDAINMDPMSIRRPFFGDIRGLGFGSDGTTLVVASRDGDVSIQLLSHEMKSIEDERQIARDRLDRGRALGLY